eukprot:gnl/TRDRNA2_/TRDRNA2_201926_c0_seq1.p1 gnl/TRDRNA2_/TRDRNA2_201926_c0~~gnl/TRDRNA2_/TRDRNA2_201926_c0_seq1.p1  ORF type:complete len:354 (-),score=40.76 gnl/TRDRNA2_/TRDRNA2_201926_c0_seq1:6-983(-)
MLDAVADPLLRDGIARSAFPFPDNSVLLSLLLCLSLAVVLSPLPADWQRAVLGNVLLLHRPAGPGVHSATCQGVERWSASEPATSKHGMAAGHARRLMDPVSSALAIDKTGKAMHDGVFGDSSGLKKFGLGNPSDEIRCAKFIVYICAEGITSDKSVLEVGGAQGGLTVGHIRELFAQSVAMTDPERGARVRHHIIMDSDGYVLAPHMAVHDFSQGCRLSLRLSGGKSRATALTKGIGGAVSDKAIGITKGIGDRISETAKETSSWFQRMVPGKKPASDAVSSDLQRIGGQLYEGATYTDPRLVGQQLWNGATISEPINSINLNR